jgi:hypothetical protein
LPIGKNFLRNVLAHSPRWWLHSCWRRTIASLFSIVRMGKGKDEWHVTPQSYGSILSNAWHEHNHLPKHTMIIIYLGTCHFMCWCCLTCLFMLYMLVFEYEMPLYVFSTLVSGLTLLNSTFGTMFMLIISSHYASKSWFHLGGS